MKKTLAVAAVLAAFAGSAMADVTMYGRIDTGFSFVDKTVDSIDADKVIDERAFNMDSGNFTGSRFGVKGSEDLGNGMKAGFVLEAGLNGTDGSAKFFDREAIVKVSGAFGEVAFGRVATLASSAGSYGKFAGIASVMGTGTLGAEGTGVFANVGTRIKNAVTYASPVMGGAQFFAQYGTIGDTAYDDEENDRYAAVLATYQAGALSLAAVAEELDEGTGGDDKQMFAVGATYDFGVAKVSLAGQYFKGANDVAGMVADLNTASAAGEWHKGFELGLVADEDDATPDTFTVDNGEGFALTLGASAPVCGGTLAASVSYLNGDGSVVLKSYTDEEEGLEAIGTTEFDAKLWNVGVNYDYNLSKQFKVYVGAGYTTYEAEADGKTMAESDTYSAYAGMVYYF